MIHPNETLASALAKLTTSHDAAFLFNEENKFQGVINPYYSIIKSSFPGNAKVEHCVYHAPRIRLNFSISKIAQLFIESKIHYLPVFDDFDRFQGIVSARHILSQFQDMPMFKTTIAEILTQKTQPLATISENDIVAVAINLFKQTKFSKLIVLSKDLKLKGILSYYDLVAYLVTPKTSPHKGEREGNKPNFYHHPVKMYAKSYVLTLTPNHTLRDVIRLILDKKIGSVVVIDSNRRPIGIVTTKDLLRFFIHQQKEKKIEIMTSNLSRQSRQILGGFFYRFKPWLQKKQDIQKAKLIVKEEKQGGLFEVVMSLLSNKGESKIVKEEGRILKQVLQKVKKEEDR